MLNGHHSTEVRNRGASYQDGVRVAERAAALPILFFAVAGVIATAAGGVASLLVPASGPRLVTWVMVAAAVALSAGVWRGFADFRSGHRRSDPVRAAPQGQQPSGPRG